MKREGLYRRIAWAVQMEGQLKEIFRSIEGAVQDLQVIRLSFDAEIRPLKIAPAVHRSISGETHERRTAGLSNIPLVRGREFDLLFSGDRFA